MTNQRIKLGREGEKSVKLLLESKGYRILETNFRTRYGEIDIITAKEDVLVFVEVKTRTGSSCGIPEEAVDLRKQEKIRKVALEYLSRSKGRHYRDLRFDVAAISAGKDGTVKEIKIYENAF